MNEKKVLDFTKTSGLCGDILVYILDEIESNPDLKELMVIHNDKKELEEAANELKTLNVGEIAIREENGKVILIIKK